MASEATPGDPPLVPSPTARCASGSGGGSAAGDATGTVADIDFNLTVMVSECVGSQADDPAPACMAPTFETRAVSVHAGQGLVTLTGEVAGTAVIEFDGSFAVAMMPATNERHVVRGIVANGSVYDWCYSGRLDEPQTDGLWPVTLFESP
jgi:hypothetical protein